MGSAWRRGLRESGDTVSQGHSLTPQNMKKTLAAFVILSALVLSGCVVGVSSVQPPHARYYGHPSLVVIPGTYVYAMTDVDDDIFFHVGWWWRQWDGRWYTSRHHDRGWNHYRGVPAFYREVDPRWREYYRHRRWHGHPWACERIPASRVQQDWHRWQNTRHWEREKNWGVQGFRPEPYRQARLSEPQRNRHEDRQRHSRREDRRLGNGSESDRRQEFARENEASRAGIPFFGNHGRGDRDTQGFERGRSRERRDNRPLPGIDRQRREVGAEEAQTGERRDERRSARNRQPFREHQTRDAEKIEAPNDRELRGQQGFRRNRPVLGQGQGESGLPDQPRQERFRERQANGAESPLFQGRQSEARAERLQADDSGLRQHRSSSRHREVEQERQQNPERRRDGHNRRRPAQQLPGGGGAPSEATDVTQPQ